MSRSDTTWRPVLPYRDAQGALIAFQDLPNGADLKPVPPDPGQEPFGVFWSRDSDLSVSTAATLGVAAVGGFSASLTTRIMVRDVMYYSEATRIKDPIGGLIWGTRWGAGFRLVLQWTTFQSSGSLGLGQIAAATELGLTTASFQIDGYGISDPSVCSLLPGPGRFDQAAYDQLMSASNALRDRYAKANPGEPPNPARAELTAVPLQLQIMHPPTLPPMESARSVQFAMKQLSLGRPLGAALNAGGDAGANAELIRMTYREQAGITEPKKPIPLPVATAAKRWLNV